MSNDLVKILDGITFIVSDPSGDIEASPRHPPVSCQDQTVATAAHDAREEATEGGARWGHVMYWSSPGLPPVRSARRLRCGSITRAL